MADLNFAEIHQYTKYYGDMNLIDNEAFWIDVLVGFQNMAIPLPLVDNAETRRRLHDLLDCDGSVCSACCHYPQVPLSPEDIERLGSDLEGIELGCNECDISFLDCTNGCQFLDGKKCGVYKKRPNVCHEFPIQSPRDAVQQGGKAFKQVLYRVKCPPSVKVIRTILRDALSQGTGILLPDLQIIPKKKETDVT